MADFGEELPLAAGMELWDPSYGGLSSAQLHNAWPLLWQTLCEETVALAALQGILPPGTSPDDIVFFTRSAAAQTPGHTRWVCWCMVCRPDAGSYTVGVLVYGVPPRRQGAVPITTRCRFYSTLSCFPSSLSPPLLLILPQ